MASDTLKQVLGVFILVVLALALSPSVASFTTDAEYSQTTEYRLIDADVSNSTSALTYAARNDSATYAYFSIVIVAGGTGAVSQYGSATIEAATNITYTESTKVVLFKSGVFNNTLTYNMSITYHTTELTSSVALVLLPIVPLLWVVAVLSVGVVMITVLLKRRG